MTNEETFEGDEKDLRGMMHALFSILLPIGLILALISSFAYCYQRFGWGGILANSLIIVIIALGGEQFTRKAEIDNEGDRS